MRAENDVSEIVRRNLDVYCELEAMDTELRCNLDGDQRRQIAPWGAVGPVEQAQQASDVWMKLDRGELSKDQAIAELKALMVIRYGQE